MNQRPKNEPAIPPDLALMALRHIEVEGRGDIEATLGSDASQEAQLETSGGDVQLHVPAKRAFLLDARTSGGTVSATGLTLTIDDGAFGQSSLKGRVNGGNALVKVRSSGGDIVIRTDGAAN